MAEEEGTDVTPAWAYNEDGLCVCCGQARSRSHGPGCELRHSLDAAVGLLRRLVGGEEQAAESGIHDDTGRCVWCGEVVEPYGGPGHDADCPWLLARGVVWPEQWDPADREERIVRLTLGGVSVMELRNLLARAESANVTDGSIELLRKLIAERESQR